MSLSVICKMLWVFVNTFTADDKYSLLQRDNFTQRIQMQVYHKQKTFSSFFSTLLKSRLNFQHFQKNLTLITNVFPKLRTRKEALKEASKKCRLVVPFDEQHGKGAQTHFKSSRVHLYHTYWSPRRILSLKKSVLVICKMLWLFVNTFTANDKYSPLHRDNFTQPIQMKLSQKEKTFSEFFSAVLKSRLNLWLFVKTFTADDKYSPLQRDNFTRPI